MTTPTNSSAEALADLFRDYLLAGGGNTMEYARLALDIATQHQAPPSRDVESFVLPELRYGDLLKHIGRYGADTFSRTRWKDGIDIEEPVAGIQALCQAYARASLRSWEESKGQG